MKISAFTTISNPDKRQDPWREAIISWAAIADEIVVVNGGEPVEYPEIDKPIRVIYKHWPEEWDWSELPKHMNAGLEACTGDWAIRFDADWIFDSSGKDKFINELSGEAKNYSVVTMQKFSSVKINTWYEKGEMQVIFNKHFPDIVIGKAMDRETDLCFPIRGVGKEKDGFGIPLGISIGERERYKSHGRFFNFDYAFKTKEVARSEFWRFAQAYKRYFGRSEFGDTQEESFGIFLDMMRGRLAKCVYDFKPDDLPEEIRERARNISKEQFAHSGWGML